MNCTGQQQPSEAYRTRRSLWFAISLVAAGLTACGRPSPADSSGPDGTTTANPATARGADTATVTGPPRAGKNADSTFGALPSGDRGIAARHPGDRGIGMDPEVIFADDFESYSSGAGLSAHWDAVYHNASITTDSSIVFAGQRSLEFVSPKQSAELNNSVGRTLRDEQDVLFMRYYSRFDTTFDVTGSSHNGGGISAHYFVGGNATPGVPANGNNKFLVEYESWREDRTEPNPGNLNVYVYHPEQRSEWGDHFFPDGRVLPNGNIPGNFGPEFVARRNRMPELGRWYAYEVMVAANTPGIRDGRIALWLDGELIADFSNLRMRNVATLRIDRVSLSLHIGTNTTGQTRKWYDNVVVARSYIGPMFGR